MEDLSHWDFAEHFKAKEVAELIMGIAPEKNTNLFGVMGEEHQHVAKITPILRRMERCYMAAGNLLNAAATWGDDAEDGLRMFPAEPQHLESEPMRQVRSTRSGYGLSLFKQDVPTFADAYFEREEIHRWLTAIGLQSVYQFVKSSTPPPEISPASRFRQQVREDTFSRMGPDREELHQWLIMDTWTAEQAMHLIAGVIPSEVYEGLGYFKFEGGLLHDDHGEKTFRLGRAADFMRLWKSNPRNPERAEPEVYFGWAQSKGIEVSWLEPAQLAGYFKAPLIQAEDKPINPKVQDTLLTIIAVLCHEAKLDHAKHAKTAGLIQSTAAKLGISIGETTIEGYLKKIPHALESRMK